MTVRGNGMKCPRCATENVEGAKFCQVCGHKVDSRALLDEYDMRLGGSFAPRNMEWWIATVTSVGMPGLGFLLAAIFYHNSKKFKNNKSFNSYRTMAISCLLIGMIPTLLLLYYLLKGWSV